MSQAGLEPARPKAPVFETGVSSYSTTTTFVLEEGVEPSCLSAPVSRTGVSACSTIRACCVFGGANGN